LWRLGAALGKVGDLASAESLCTVALATCDSAYGADDPELADIHFVLGSILVQRGRVAEAGRHAEKAKAIASATYGPHSPEAGQAQSLFALTLAARGETARALNLALDLEARSREDVATVSRALPEREALQYSAIRPNGLDLALSITSNRSTGSVSGTRRAWDALVRSRAMVFDLMSARQRSLGADSDPKTREIAGRSCCTYRAKRRSHASTARAPKRTASNGRSPRGSNPSPATRRA
jgi:tetratricopeptide (TPR) repeat protein